MTTNILVPAYFYPAGNTYWTDLQYLAFTMPYNSVTAILNVSNGHFTSTDANYTVAVDNFVGAGGKVVGYVYSNYGARAIADVKSDIANYIALYPQVTGFFIDEMSNLQSNVAYYQELHDYIKSLSPNYSVIGNPGATTLESYMPTADILVTFEGSGASYQNYTPASWMANYTTDHFAHLIYGVATSADVLITEQHALFTGGGNIYITNDQYIPGNLAYQNPWDTLSSYYLDNQMMGTSLNDNMYGSLGNDQIIGGSGDDTLNGGAGNDFIEGGEGNDQIDGGGDNFDYASYLSATSGVTVNLTVTTAQNTLGAGVDTLVNVESLYGSTFNDTLTGSSGSNGLMGFAGNDILIGGAGDDFYIEGDSGDDIINGGDGVDMAAYGSALSGVVVSLTTTIAQNTFGAGFDTLISIEGLYGSDFNDTLIGNGSDNEIYGNNGDNTIFGGGGNDVLFGGMNSDNIFGENGDDWVYGGDGNDYLDGGAGNDSIRGSKGDDTLYGGAGSDTLIGGVGNDLYILDFYPKGRGLMAAYSNSQPDKLIELANQGVDTLVLYGAVSFANRGRMNLHERNTITIVGSELENIDANATSSTVLNLTGNDYDNVLIGNVGNNRLIGGLGDDTLNGGAGSDFIYAGLDDDTLIGGDGKDYLTGGLGADAFDYNVIGESVIGANCDVITDLNHSEFDKIDLSSIDANLNLANDQAFVFIGNNVAFSDAGQLRYDTALHTVFGEVDGISGADFQIELTGVASLSAIDFNL